MRYLILFKTRFLLFLTLFCFAISFQGNSQNKNEIDSLKQLISKANKDTNKARLLVKLGIQYRYISSDSSLMFFQQALNISNEIGSEKDIIKCANELGTVYRIIGSYDKATKHFLNALKISEKLVDKTWMSKLYGNLGIIYIEQGLYDKAIEFFMKALKVFEELGNKNAMSKCYSSIGIIHADQGSDANAIEYFLKSLKIKEELGDKRGIAMLNGNIGILHAGQGNYEKAYSYYLKSLKIFEEIGDKRQMAISYGNIGVVYKERESYDEAIKYYIKSLNINKELGDKKGIATAYFNIAALNIKLSNSKKLTREQKSNYMNIAIDYANKSLEIAREINAMPIVNEVAEFLYNVHKELGNFKKSVEFADLYITTKDSMFNEDKTNAIQEMETKYETEKKQQQIELQESQLLIKDAKIKQQKTVKNALLSGLLAFVVIIVLVIYAYVQKRKSNIKISKQKDEIEQKNVILHKQKEEITDSIHYAKRIQSAVLPPAELLSESLPEHFILFKPRDIVSGDFYWMKKINDLTVITAVDCTGHGVPGAFMSMLGIAFLNEIVRKKEVTTASDILNELRFQIKTALRQVGKEGEAKDGMDLALCIIDHKNMKLQYAGAYNPLYLFRKNDDIIEFTEIKADKMPIGIYVKEKESFANHEIKLQEKDTFYIFSDGFQDQIGGKNSRKYMTKNFRNLLFEIQKSTMADQIKILDKSIEDWKNCANSDGKPHEQLDDILVIGVRV